MQQRDRVFSTDQFMWAIGSLCSLHRVPFDADLLLKQVPPPYDSAALIRTARSLGFKIKEQRASAAKLHKQSLPCLVVLNASETMDRIEPALNDDADVSQPSNTVVATGGLGIALKTEQDRVLLARAGESSPMTLSIQEFKAEFTGTLFLIARAAKGATDPDADAAKPRAFGFRWFVPELMRHRKVWRDVLLASLILQLLALAMPLFTQTIIDKVIVHHTQSTLIAIAIGLGVFMVFSSLLTWVRQYLILHTGNRVDAVLGASVFEHLFNLPPRYFQNRPTGVISARLHGVETIREFIASAAVTLILDCPFLLICVALMFTYSVKLTLIVLGILAVIVLLSIAVAPIFQGKLSQQFLLGARNQAFVTEYVSGLETVKSLQMEPQLRSTYSGYLATYLQAGFEMKQTANTYNVVAGFLEQLMTMSILLVGAYTVMTQTGAEAFTIGMLVAFQMFAGKLSQPVMRLVGLWQQFQQASLAVNRLGDLMNAPTEPYSLTPSRVMDGQGKIEFQDVAFRYGDDRPFLYKNLNINIQPGETIALMGPSGCGKSTLAKLLQGFYQTTDGQIKIDGTNIRNMSANELRSYFGVVPQETVLFSGTIYENLILANPHATFEDVVHACKMAEVHQVIEELPQGYQTEIGERGAGLSGGQKQRIAIARALLKQPKILIFDEATSSLDQQTAEHFAKTINALKGQVTMLFITHALPKGLAVDHLVRLDAAGNMLPTAVPARHDHETAHNF